MKLFRRKVNQNKISVMMLSNGVMRLKYKRHTFTVHLRRNRRTDHQLTIEAKNRFVEHLRLKKGFK